MPDLTTKFVQHVKPPAEGRQDYSDTGLPGFVLRVTSTGAKSFTVRYKVRGAGQPQQRYTIGPYPAVSLSTARDRARAILEAAHGGVDLPAQEAETATAERAAQAAANEHTVNRIADLYYADYCRNRMENSRVSCGRELHYLREAWGERPISSITAADAKALVKKIAADKPVMANRVWGRINAFFGWSADGDTPYLEANPCAGVKKSRLVDTMVLTKEKPRQRYLKPEEIRSVLLACDAMGYPAGWYIKMMLYTGQRRDEVRELPWAEIDESAGNWMLAPERNGKGKRLHLVPLPTQVRAMLSHVRKIQPPGREFVWTSSHKPNRPYSSSHEPKQRLDALSGVKDWHLHDLRHTVRTGLSELGVREDIAERVINHAVGGAMGKVYNHWEFAAEKAAALQAWADYLDRLMQQPGAQGALPGEQGAEAATVDA